MLLLLFFNQNIHDQCDSQVILLFMHADQFSSSVVSDYETPWITARQASLSIINSWSLFKQCPSSQWCHPAISSSVIPFSSFPQSLPASGSFPMSQLFTWGGQGIGVSASASVLPMNIQGWFPLRLTGLISLQPKGLFCKINKWISKATYTGICCLDLHMHVRINLRPNQPLVTLNLRFTFESNAFFCPQHLICVTVSPTHSFIQKYLLRTYYMSGNVCVLGIPWWEKLPPLMEPTF